MAKSNKGFSLPLGGKKKVKKIAGIDIGTFEIKVIEIKIDDKGGVQLLKAHKKTIAQGSIVDKDIRDREGLIYNLQNMVDEVDPDITEVAISVSGHKVLVDKIDVKKPSGKGKLDSQMFEAVMIEAEQRIPTGIDSVQLDFYQLDAPPDAKTVPVMLFAARREFVDDYISVVMDAGLVPYMIGLDAICLFNAFQYNYDIPSTGVVALMNIGHALSNVAFIINGKLFSIRDISNAGKSIWDRLQTELHLSTDDLKSFMHGKTRIERSQQNQRAIFNSTEDLGIGLGMALSYLENITGGMKVDMAYLSGGATAIPFFKECIENRISVPCDILNPFIKVNYDPAVFGDIPFEFAKPLYAIATGIALSAKEVDND